MAGGQAVRAGRAFVEIVLRNKVKQGLDQVAKQLGAFGKVTAAIGAGLTAASASIIGPLAAAVSHFSDAGDAVDKMAARTGLSTEAVSELAHAADLSGLVKTDELPRLAAVSGFVDTAPGRDVAAYAVGPRAHINDVGIGVGHRDRTHRSDRDLPIRDRRPRRAAVCRPPQSTTRRAHIEGSRLRRHSRDRRHPPATRGTHQAISKAFEQRGFGRWWL